MSILSSSAKEYNLNDAALFSLLVKSLSISLTGWVIVLRDKLHFSNLFLLSGNKIVDVSFAHLLIHLAMYWYEVGLNEVKDKEEEEEEEKNK